MTRRRGALRAWLGATFDALHNPNFRLYFSGQAVSLVGTNMQMVAQSWLVLQLSGTATALGLVVAVQTLPILLLSPYAGLVVDRTDKHRLIMVTQLVLGLLAAVLWLLTAAHVVALWMVVLLAAALGITTSVDNPARQAFVSEMVGVEAVGNAVTLNSVLMNAARAVGPAVAGLLIVTTGVGPCFLLNALSFSAVLVALARMDRRRLHPATRPHRAPGQLMEGLRYVWHTRALLVPLLMMALVGALSYEFMVVLPVLARTTFGGDADAYGLLTAVFGAGAVLGGLVVAGRPARGLRDVVLAAAAFGVTMLLAAAAPTLPLEAAALTLVGAASVAFMSRGNATLQLGSVPQMRGRVMALWTVAFLGTTPVGGPIIGWICAAFGPRWGLVTGGSAAIVAVLVAVAARHLARGPRAPSADDRTAEAAAKAAELEVTESQHLSW